MGFTNQYHILSFLPGVEGWEMPPALETLAQRLVASGRLRINADTERNFVRHGTADSDDNFSTRELTDPALLPATKRRLARHVAPAAGTQGLADILALLHIDLRKARGIAPEKELRVARIVVQSAHPSVIQLLLASRTEVFVSYSHNVSDLMPVHRWQTDGLNSGLQATETNGTAVYISCGGDPFFEGENKTYTTDGFPALARMMVIGGQELGHFSDLLRQNGHIQGRYSTDAHHMHLRAAPVVADGRNFDMRNTAVLLSRFRACGLPRLIAAEKSVDFYSARWKYSLPWVFHQLSRLIARTQFVIRCKQQSIHVKLSTYPTLRHGESIAKFLDDMAFNLAPDADVYRRSDPLEEEAIACIESLARVPQQMHKWGYQAVQFAWPKLYAIYYGTVIPGCIAASPEAPVSLELSRSQRIRRTMRRLLRHRPDYYPE